MMKVAEVAKEGAADLIDCERGACVVCQKSLRLHAMDSVGHEAILVVADSGDRHYLHSTFMQVIPA